MSNFLFSKCTGHQYRKKRTLVIKKHEFDQV
jgi:hypothetical protein